MQDVFIMKQRPRTQVEEKYQGIRATKRGTCQDAVHLALVQTLYRSSSITSMCRVPADSPAEPPPLPPPGPARKPSYPCQRHYNTAARPHHLDLCACYPGHVGLLLSLHQRAAGTAAGLEQVPSDRGLREQGGL